MKPLDAKYQKQLDAIAQELQDSEEFGRYLDEEEEEDYQAIRELIEPKINEVYHEVAEKEPLQLIALERAMLDEKFEGMYLPRILGFSVLRGEVNADYKYVRPQVQFLDILTTICNSSNFDLVKKRIGQTVQMGFALSSDIRVTNLINQFENKKVKYFLQSQKLPRYRDPKERAIGLARYKNQFRSENFYTAEFPKSRPDLAIFSSSLMNFLKYRITHNKDNASVLPEIKAYLNNEQLKNSPQYVETICLCSHFFPFSDADNSELSNLLNDCRKSFPDFEEVWWNFILRTHTEGPRIDATADAKVSSLLDHNIKDELTPYYELMNTIHSKGYIHPDGVEAVREFYGNYEGLSTINENVRKTILNYIGSFLDNISEEDYAEYFELSKIFPVYMGLFSNQQFNQELKDRCMAYIKRLLKRYTDKRGKDYQDIKKFVTGNFQDLNFMTEKQLVELFKTRRKRKAPTA